MSWEEKYSIGIAEIDEQHRALATCIERLESSVRGEERWIVIHSTLVEIASWAQVHFAVEEALMRVARYPRIDGHVGQHRDFSARIARLQRESLASDVGAETSRLLRDWLERHIVGFDRDYADFMRARLERDPQAG